MIDATRRDLLAAAASLAVAPALAARPEPDDLTATRAALAAGRITAPELVEAAIARLERVDGRLNAVTARTYDIARAAARSIPGAIPIVTKDNAPIAGQPWSQGSRAWRDRIAAETQPYLAAVLAAGFVSIARSACPEFGLAPTTEAQLIGPTRNPWALDRSTGGSSGGSAALVAAGVVPVAHGNDGGGSLRIPASACGVVAQKTTRHGAGEDRPMAASGCLSRTVRDTAAWTAAFSGLDLRPGRPGPLRIVATLDPPAGGLVDPEVARVFDETLATLAAAGHRVTRISLPYDGVAFVDAFLILYAVSALRAVQAFEKAFHRLPTPADFEPLTLGLAASAVAAGEARAAAAGKIVSAEAASYRNTFAQADVFVSPVLAEPPARIGRFAPTLPWAAQRDDLIGYATYTFMQNAANTPAISLPMGWSAGGLPIGIQFAAGLDQDAVLIRLGLELEQRRPWRDRRPPVWAG